jgi:signal transduction histidine kinase
METFLTQIFTILTSPPGNLIYHLVIAFCIAAALQGSIVYQRTPQRKAARRMSFGLALILVVQFLLFFSTGLSWQGLASPDVFLPVLDRAATTFCLIWIIWLWSFPEKKNWGDALAGALSVLVMIGLALSLSSWWKNSPPKTFNYSELDIIWELSTIFLVLMGSVYLIIKRPTSWGIGLGMMVLMAVGAVIHLVFPAGDGNFSGPVRLAQLAAFPMLLTLPQRLAGLPQAASLPSTTDRRAPGQERRRYSADPKTVHAFLRLATESEPAKVPLAISRSIGQAMLADMCLLISLPDASGQVTIRAGYDLIGENYIENISLPQEKIPQIIASLQHNRPTRLLSSHVSSPDMKSLAEAFSLSSPGNLLAVPINGLQGQPSGGILLLSSHSNRVWSDDDQAYLTSVSNGVAQILQRSQIVSTPVSPSGSQDRPGISDQPNLELEKELVTLRNKNEELLHQLNQLQAVESKKDVTHLEGELKLALEETARLQNALGESNIKILEMERSIAPGVQLSRSQTDAIVSIIQELRHPVSAMINQSDLLIKEAGEETLPDQSKYIGRMKAASERMAGLMDELVGTIAVYKQNMEMLPDTTDLTAVIDEAISYTYQQMRARNISLQLDLPDSLPSLYADRDALQQTLIYILQNAEMASPEEGTVQIKAGIQDGGEDQQYALLQVTDTGGGIPEAEIPHLFSDFYSHNRQIPGTGSPQDLVMAKTLVESNGGRIWVETEPGRSSTICILLPLASKSSPVVIPTNDTP